MSNQPLVKDPNDIRIAMIGMVEGNGHPFSWSAIINGEYDPAAMAECGYPGIVQYLSAAPTDALGIRGARVTHVWCDRTADAKLVARASKVAHVVDGKPTDIIGHVDAVVIATDIPDEHLDRARPFLDAGLPVFIDKPLTDRADHLREFVRRRASGQRFLSSSCMRYAKEFVDLRRPERLAPLGDLRLITITTMKSFERYGIHALEGVYPFLESGGWISATNTGREGADVVHYRHTSGVDVIVVARLDMYGSFCHLGVHGNKSVARAEFTDTLHAFKSQLVDFVEYLRTGREPFPFDQTIELMKLIIAGLRSRREGGRTVMLSEIREMD
jgi:predicted dehydrogenase